MEVSVSGTVITVDGGEDEVVIVFRDTSTVALLALEHDDEVDTVTMTTNVVSKFPTVLREVNLQ